MLNVKKKCAWLILLGFLESTYDIKWTVQKISVSQTISGNGKYYKVVAFISC